MTLLTHRRVKLGALVKPRNSAMHFLVVDLAEPDLVVCARPDLPDWTTREANLQTVKQPRVWKDRKRGQHAGR